MAIGSALERGSFIFAYDEHGRTLFQKARGSGPNDGLLGSLAPPSPHGTVRSGYDDLLKGGMTGCPP